MKKEIILKLNKKESELVKDALENLKVVVRIKVYTDNMKRKELAIKELYNIESVEKKLKAAE